MTCKRCYMLTSIHNYSGRPAARLKQASNAFTSGSFWHYHITAGENGGSQVDFTIHRVGKNLKGHMLATLLRVFGRRIFRQDLDRTLQRLAEESPATALS